MLSILLTVGLTALCCQGGEYRFDGIFIADPSIYSESGTNYLIGTEGHFSPAKNGAKFPILAAPSGSYAWQPIRTTAGESRVLSKDALFGKDKFWAPQLFKHNGRYYFAYTCDLHWGIAAADCLAGPYAPHAEFPKGKGRIDPYVFFDDDGKAYAVFSDWKVSGISVVELTSDLRGWKGEPKRCVANDQPWEHLPLEEGFVRMNAQYGYSNRTAYKANPKVIEGPTLLKRRGKYVLFYSANDFRSPDYCVCVAVADCVFGPWKKLQRGPVLSRQKIGLNGIGHGDVYFERGEMWYVFHYHHSDHAIDPRRTGTIRLIETWDADGYPRYAAHGH